jgi:hypothetical protein
MTMDISTLLLQNISSTSIFAMRPMLGMFVVGLLAQGLYNAALSAAPGLITPAMMPWIASNEMLILLFLLAFIEFALESNGDLRFWYESLSGFVQPGSAFVVSFAVVDTQAVYYVELWIAGLPPETLAALASTLGLAVPVASTAAGGLDGGMVADALSWLGHVVAGAWAALMAASAWMIGTIRSGVLELFFDLDEDDTLGSHGVLALSEYGLATIISVAIFFAPLIALGLFGLTVLGLWLVRRFFEHRELTQMVACGACGGKMHRTAIACPTCRVTNSTPVQVGWFGQPRSAPVSDLPAHRLALVGRRRCPVCAERLKERDVQQSCTACGTVTFADIADANTFLRALDARLPRTLVVSGLLGLVPVVGLIPAVIYYRLSLIASLRGYLPRSTGCVTRWAVRLINLFLVMLQPIPLFGALVVPAMCAISYSLHRKVVSASMTSKLTRTFDSPVAPAGFALAAAGSGAPPAVMPVALSEGEVVCSSCGAASAGNARFCTTCGARMSHPAG